MYGKIMSITDELMLRYYDLLSSLSVDELQRLKEGLKDGSLHPMKAKEALAFEITERYWGKQEALRAKEGFINVFRRKELPVDMPEIHVDWDEPSLWLPKLLKLSGLAPSVSEARRLIGQGGVRVNENKITDPETKLPRGSYIIQAGKRKFAKIVPR